MIRLNKNIAIFLLGIFIFPITFQAFHIIWHHSHDYHGHHKLYQVEVTKKPFQTDIRAASQKKKHCPICNYEFSINDLPKVFIFRSINLVIESSLNKLELQLPFQQAISIKVPRAPPILYY